MTRTGWWLIPVLIIALLIGGAIGAFVAGWDGNEKVVQITTPSGEQAGEPAQVVRVEDDDRWHGRGFFPFGFLLFPLLWIGIFWLFFGGFWRRGPGWARWDERFEEWHRRQHGDDSPGSSGASAASA